jgi:hydrogenase expression/formation protein HypC
MCLSIPSKVVKIDKESNTAVVDTMGVTRKAGLELVEEGTVKVGDYVLIHIGFVMNKIDEEDALESLKVYNEILTKMDEQEGENLVLEDEKVNGEAREAPLGDNCDNRGL